MHLTLLNTYESRRDIRTMLLQRCTILKNKQPNRLLSVTRITYRTAIKKNKTIYGPLPFNTNFPLWNLTAEVFSHHFSLPEKAFLAKFLQEVATNDTDAGAVRKPGNLVTHTNDGISISIGLLGARGKTLFWVPICPPNVM